MVAPTHLVFGNLALKRAHQRDKHASQQINCILPSCMNRLVEDSCLTRESQLLFKLIQGGKADFDEVQELIALSPAASLRNV